MRGSASDSSGTKVVSIRMTIIARKGAMSFFATCSTGRPATLEATKSEMP